MAKLASVSGSVWQKVVHRDMSGLGLIDYALMGIGSCLAVWSAGMAVGNERLGWFSAALVAIGTLISFGIRSLFRGTPLLKLDGVLYAVAGLCSFFFTMRLQQYMPDQGFPRELFAAGWLTWMLIFGSMVGWRDSTLLFQAVPSIAMFGLVGCYDTYRNVIFPFYGFLVCLATFFARAHGRQMLEESVSSGFFNRGLAPGAPQVRPETTPGLAQKLRQGPWRWIAGPEWALASALVVVLISLAGAPMIQRSVQGVAGFVKVAAPRIAQNSTLPPLVRSGQSSSSIGIGRGPVELTEKPVLSVRMDRFRYLRASTYDRYNGRGWSTNNGVINPDQPTAQSLAVAEIEHPVEYEWRIRLQQPLRVLPVPTEVIRSTLATAMVSRGDGSIELTTMMRAWQELGGVSMEAGEGSDAKDAGFLPPSVGEFSSTANIDPRVLTLAREAAGSGKSDWEKAQAIQREIESRIRYNINAQAIPDEEDAVAYTLFESKEAYCDLFASSMVLMARAVGIPARYATGFLPKWENRLGDGAVLVKEKDAHAWAELYFKGVGWVPFDATEGAEEVSGSGVGASSADSAWYRQPWFTLLLDGIMVCLGIGAIYVGYRKFAFAKAHPNFRTDLDKVYLTFTRLLYKSTGVRRTVGVTADEYIELVRPKLGSHAGLAEAANASFVAAYYAPGGVDQTSLQTMRQKVAELKQQLRKAKKQ